MILILTNKEDLHPTPVIEKIAGQPIFRINCEDFLTDYSFQWESKNGETNWQITNLTNNLKITKEEVVSIWERRPERVKELKKEIQDERIKKFCTDEATSFLKFFRYSLQDKFWIGNPLVDISAQSRLLQHSVANKLGIRCPKTLYSNDSVALKNFAREFNYLCIKTIDRDSITLDDYYISFGGSRIPSESLLEMDKDALELTISYLQEYIEKQFELRITVVCDNVFACKLDSQELPEDKGKIDWRDGLFEGLKHEKYELPKYVEEFCIHYLKEMNQTFGAFDFIVTPENDFVFLECNSNGQWLWIELETGMNISGAIASQLIKGKW